MKNTTSLFCHQHRAALCLLTLFMAPSALAETITIFKGKGILWEGLPFSVGFDAPMNNSMAKVDLGLLAITTDPQKCQAATELTTIENYQALKIAPGVGLIPRASGTMYFTKYRKSAVTTFTGTIGLPETKGRTNDGDSTKYHANLSWCLGLVDSNTPDFYDVYAQRFGHLSGTWVLVADGTQKNSEVTIPAIYAATFAYNNGNTRTHSIFPSDFKLRISTLECTVNTPTSIAFGSVATNIQAGAELGILSYPLITTCGQKSDVIDANINLQFRPLSGLYNNAPTRLALNQGGGYVTGEIDNGVTGSGSCTATTGLPFDNTELKVGSITKAQTSATFTHQVTWRLCSGGKDLPLGDVSAAAEMLVTFN